MRTREEPVSALENRRDPAVVIATRRRSTILGTARAWNFWGPTGLVGRMGMEPRRAQELSVPSAREDETMKAHEDAEH